MPSPFLKVRYVKRWIMTEISTQEDDLSYVSKWHVCSLVIFSPYFFNFFHFFQFNSSYFEDLVPSQEFLYSVPFPMWEEIHVAVWNAVWHTPMSWTPPTTAAANNAGQPSFLCLARIVLENSTARTGQRGPHRSRRCSARGHFQLPSSPQANGFRAMSAHRTAKPSGVNAATQNVAPASFCLLLKAWDGGGMLRCLSG